MYVSSSEDLAGSMSAKIVRTGEWWLNPEHDHPMVRVYEYKWWCEHPTLRLRPRIHAADLARRLGLAPYCPQCTIAEQERIIGDLASRLKAFEVVLAGEQALRAVILSRSRRCSQASRQNAMW